MKAGYTVSNVSFTGSKIVEVINYEHSNRVLNMGWIFPKTPYKTKDENTVGVWKIKQLKN